MDSMQARDALRRYFGYDTFRPLQQEIIETAYARQDALVLMPTGGGKSLCFQIPAVTMPGTAVVVSPLISLMKDQVEGLLAVGIRAAYYNSSQSAAEQAIVENDFSTGELNLLYVSPERLLSAGFMSVLRRRRINLFAIDEAHCISAWGHDFRPEYTQLRSLKENFPNTPVMALTATADRLTRRDIIDQLGLQAPACFVASFDRPNLSLEVRAGQRRYEQIARFLRNRQDEPGIIYTLSRKSTEQLAQKLRADGHNAAAYHAKLPSNDRSKVQEDFINDRTTIVCATIAFGMGIDKSNVRWVIHYNLPKNIENYYQEIGRSGRDGAPAATLLFYSYGDVQMLRDIITSNQSENHAVQLAKLDRMQQYAESLACRRRILLNYFSEDHAEDCGNCDICRNPPQRFNGTVLAQQALSAVYRLRERTGVNMTIDVLRGSGKRELLERGYDQIKTYGAGRAHSAYDWQHYISQLINLGYLLVAHEENNVLRLTPASQRVLFDGEAVELVRMATVRERQEEGKNQAKQKAGARERVRDSLFEHLRQLRKQLAQQQGVPPYLIFSDATLEEMAATRPRNDLEFSRINGVGERKLQRYGDAFIQAIVSYGDSTETSGKGNSHRASYALYRKGKSVDEIAQERQIQPTTVYSHLAACYAAGESLNIIDFVPLEVIGRVQRALPYLEQPYQLGAIRTYLNNQPTYPQIRFALAHLEREGLLAAK